MRPCVTPPLIIRGTEFGGAKPLFCVPLVAEGPKELLDQAAVARRVQADVVEWRADSLMEFTVDSIRNAAQKLRHVLDREPLLFTARSRSEGGLREIGERQRVQCIEAALHSNCVDLVDIELSSGSEVVAQVVANAHASSKHVILSFHDFEATPPDEFLFDKISAMISAGADIAKIACTPRGPEDVLRLLDVTLRARRAFPNSPLCTMSMGALGLVSRLGGFLFGSDMAFAVGAAASAPGQISITEARAVTGTLLRDRV